MTTTSTAAPLSAEQLDVRQYRKKPVVVEAIQFKKTTSVDELPGMSEAPEWLTEAVMQGDYLVVDGVARISTLEGVMTAQPGDWIIRGVKGEIYPCKPDIFAATYEPVITQARVAQVPQATAPQPSVGERADERALFKAWWAKRVPAGSDSDHAAIFAFEVWQAARAPSPSREEAPAAMAVEARGLLNADELAALRRFDECAQDGEGYDVPKEMMQRLAEIGVLQRRSGAYYQATEFGQSVLGNAPAASVAQAEDAAEPPSKKQEELHALADRIDHEKLWKRPMMYRDRLTDDQRNRLDAAVNLRRYADLLAPGRWLVLPPTGNLQFSAGSLEAVTEMAKRDQDRRAMPSAQHSAKAGGAE
jgi:hypothetical protein